MLFNNAFMIHSVIILTVALSSNFSSFPFKFKTGLQVTIYHTTSQQTFVLMKTSWKRLEDVFRLCLQKTSSRRFQDVFIKTNVKLIIMKLNFQKLKPKVMIYKGSRLFFNDSFGEYLLSKLPMQWKTLVHPLIFLKNF